MTQKIGFPTRRYSALAHGCLPIAAPVGMDVLDGLLDVLRLPPEARILDVGCGRGEILLRCVEKFSAHGTGVDSDAAAIAAARNGARDRGLEARVTWVEGPALDLPPHAPFDLALCIGASHACGGYAEALGFMTGRVSDKGYLLVGEGFWKKEPDPEFLRAIGSTPADLGTHYGNIRTAYGRGLTPVWSFVSRDADWDRYEGLYRLAMSAHLRANPDDPEYDAFRTRSEAWYDAYLRWGRDTFGFALYLFERSETPAVPGGSTGG